MEAHSVMLNPSREVGPRHGAKSFMAREGAGRDPVKGFGGGPDVVRAVKGKNALCSRALGGD